MSTFWQYCNLTNPYLTKPWLTILASPSLTLSGLSYPSTLLKCPFLISCQMFFSEFPKIWQNNFVTAKVQLCFNLKRNHKSLNPIFLPRLSRQCCRGVAHSPGWEPRLAMLQKIGSSRSKTTRDKLTDQVFISPNYVLLKVHIL